MALPQSNSKRALALLAVCLLAIGFAVFMALRPSPDAVDGGTKVQQGERSTGISDPEVEKMRQALSDAKKGNSSHP